MVQRTWFTLIILPYTGFLFHSIDYTRENNNVCTYRPRWKHVYVRGGTKLWLTVVCARSLSNVGWKSRWGGRRQNDCIARFDELHISSRLLPAGGAKSCLSSFARRLSCFTSMQVCMKLHPVPFSRPRPLLSPIPVILFLCIFGRFSFTDIGAHLCRDGAKGGRAGPRPPYRSVFPLTAISDRINFSVSGLHRPPCRSVTRHHAPISPNYNW
jgi:hypothetical protein